MDIKMGKILTIGAGVGLVGLLGFKSTPKGGTGNTAPANDGAMAPANSTASADQFAPTSPADPLAAQTPATGGAYSVVQDSQSGMQFVVDTATQQLVGVLDAQGNVTPITVDANGNVALAQQASTGAQALTPAGAQPLTTGTAQPQEITGGQPQTTSDIASTDRSAAYAQIAYELFVNATAPSESVSMSTATQGAANLVSAAPVAGNSGVAGSAVGTVAGSAAGIG